MSARKLATVVRPEPLPGTQILRPFPSPALPHLDPFVFLDTGAPLTLGDRDLYVGPHPHRGVQPVGLVFRGRVHHRDSLGHEATVTSGGMQWLMAGSGALHEEVLQGDADGVFHMAQVWVNLPQDRKLEAPAHHAWPASAVPTVDLGSGATARLYAGRLGGAEGPAPQITPLLLALVTVAPGGRVSVPVPEGWNVGFTVVDGAFEVVGAGPLVTGATAVFDIAGHTVEATSDAGGQLLLMAGEPIGEPVVMGGGFVMTRDADLAQAHDDVRAGRMGTLVPSRPRPSA